MADKPKPLDDDEMVEVLQEIIRTSGNAAARIAAIKQLRELRQVAGETPARQAEAATDDPFAALDSGFAATDELASRRKRA